MYQPTRYKVEDRSLMDRIVQGEGFGALTSVYEGEAVINHLPFVLDGNRLVSHMARANPHWKTFQQSPKCKVIFQGPHGYISPAWYAPKDDNVPTWNYAVVHVSGRARILDGDEAYEAMKLMVDTFETKYKTGWRLPEPKHPSIDALMKAIVVFALDEIEFSGKFKLSQNKTGADHHSVVTALDRSGVGELQNLAELMRENVSKV